MKRASASTNFPNNPEATGEWSRNVTKNLIWMGASDNTFYADCTGEDSLTTCIISAIETSRGVASKVPTQALHTSTIGYRIATVKLP